MLVKEQREAYTGELLDLRNDYVFKSFFGDKRNKNLLLKFLNAVLDVDIHAIKLTDPHIERNHPTDKKSIMDVRVQTASGDQINIEMQMAGHRAFPERMYMYMAKMYVSQDEAGKKYSDYRRAVQIIITNFELLEEDDFHNVYKITNQKSGSIFTTHYETHVLELPKLIKEDIKETTELEKWLLFLKSDQQIKEALAMESPTMKEAFEEIERLSQNPETRRFAAFREQELKDILEREEEAREQGMEQEKQETVIRMYSDGMSVESITKYVNLSRDKVIEIIKLMEQ
ncbi:Rpn family recombination-promoting nuclease/putative transposase [Sporosarcina beigongshangi]|uniref:Rpn family recombination-promoting nuclease/putative transposase n=1 Tax=Sporosarcina beigongshangi TaxID=2782538 RepID=UPI001E2EDC7C|nr:Rpn family recombination-promoting nuclease/putative transposase [Sporosarcina beigongshangi]